MRRVDIRLSSCSDAYKRTSGLSEMTDNPEVTSLWLEGLRELDSFYFFILYPMQDLLCCPAFSVCCSLHLDLSHWRMGLDWFRFNSQHHYPNNRMILYAAAAAKSLQSCPTLCNPIDGSPPGSPVPGILLARALEWVAISFSNAWKGKVKVKSLSRVWLLATPWTAAHQAPPSMGFSRQEYWSGVPLPSLDLV